LDHGVAILKRLEEKDKMGTGDFLAVAEKGNVIFIYTDGWDNIGDMRMRISERIVRLGRIPLAYQARRLSRASSRPGIGIWG
jgi:hypothetical protein